MAGATASPLPPEIGRPISCVAADHDSLLADCARQNSNRISALGNSRFGGHMFRHIMAASDDSPQATRALEVAIELAKQLNTGLYRIVASEQLLSYTAFIDVEMPGGRRMLLDERGAYYRELQKRAMTQVSAAGVDVRGLVTEGAEVQAIIDRIAEYNLDLLVLGRRHHTAITWLWG